jgi:DNA-binding NarL/FixJ family response regulator
MLHGTVMAKAIRVLVANHPRLMRDIVLTTFSDQPDIEIVGEVSEESDIAESVKRTLPDFVVIALDHPGSRPEICDELLREHPQVHVIAVAQEINYIVCYWASFEIHSNSVEASEQGILNAIRKKLLINGNN